MPRLTEDLSSQVPAIQVLVNLGYTYVPPAEALAWRDGSTAEVLFPAILASQLRQLNPITHLGKAYRISDAGIDGAIRRLRDVSIAEGIHVANRVAHELLTLGYTHDDRYDGKRASKTLRYIDWTNWRNNVFHVTEELSVQRDGRPDHYRPDIALYVNGIPFAVLECKDLSIRGPISEAISQHLRNQKRGGLRKLYKLVQLTGALAVSEASYATVGTSEEFWSVWRERFYGSEKERDEAETAHRDAKRNAQNTPLKPADQRRIVEATDKPHEQDYRRQVLAKAAPATADVMGASSAVKEIGARALSTLDPSPAYRPEPTAQTALLYDVFRPERLLRLAGDFSLFDGGTRKVARYQQYFAVQRTLARVMPLNAAGQREGGIVWHTQGSGKSLTMVMLARAIFRHAAMDGREPQVVIVTDRVDLDEQIHGTFLDCGIQRVSRAATGTELRRLLADGKRKVVTTIINKFDTAIRSLGRQPPITSPDIFLLVDEAHRTQYGSFAASLDLTLPKACAIAFTGTPISKKDRDTNERFGRYIDKYRINEAVADGAVLKLLYENRMPVLDVQRDAIDAKAERLADDYGLDATQRGEREEHHARMEKLLTTEQRLRQVMEDIVRHYTKELQPNVVTVGGQARPSKAQFVTRDKHTAVRYYYLFKQTGKISVELVISPPDTRAGHEDVSTASDNLVLKFWGEMMDRYGTAEKYQREVVSKFKRHGPPELIVVVSKLLTGFDAPYNTVLYVDKNLREENLLQAIARVNRRAEGKDFGYVIDYRGMLPELQEALASQQDDEEDAEDVRAAVTDSTDELTKLPEVHARALHYFPGLTEARHPDVDHWTSYLREDDRRDEFYADLGNFLRLMKVADATAAWRRDTPKATVAGYQRDRAWLRKIKTAAGNRFSETIDFARYDAQLTRILHEHVTSYEVERLGEPVDIFDVAAFEQQLETATSDEARADIIQSRTSKHLRENMRRNPAQYRKFSQLLQEALEEYRRTRDTVEYLRRVTQIKDQVMSGGDTEGMPPAIRGNEPAVAVYASLGASLGDRVSPAGKTALPQLSLKLVSRIRHAVTEGGRERVDWQHNDGVLGMLKLDLTDELYEASIYGEASVPGYDVLRQLAADLVELAKQRSWS